MVKRTHHVKGILFVLNKNGIITKLLFYSYPSDIAKNIPYCNVMDGIQNLNHKKENICFGEIFVCPQKDMNIKIIIDINDVRLILKRIYFYRKTGVEIFTNTKCYYFNFLDEDSANNLVMMMCFYFDKKNFISIGKDNKIFGYCSIFPKIPEKDVDGNKNKNIDIWSLDKLISKILDFWNPYVKDYEFSTFDIIIFLNLLSNRSYIDLFQYPIFPVLFLYDKNLKNDNYIFLPRDLKNHIGFQSFSEKSKKRKNNIKLSYNDSIQILEENYNDNDEKENIPFYFTTHYSNIVYTSNYLIRFFPYSFLSIELQGSDFDNPNRLFFSILASFYNISCQKGDVRELIPEFFYFPEMFLNINKINFGKRNNSILVDDVDIPMDVNIQNKNNIDNNNENNNYENSNYFRAFKFVEKMRKTLETNPDINHWINIIFGTKAKYKDDDKKGLYFRTESYIDFSDEKDMELKNFNKDHAIMQSVDFGIIPIQIIFDKEIINNGNKNIIYDKKVKDNKELLQNIYQDFIALMDSQKEYNNKYYKEKEKNKNNYIKKSKIYYLNKYSKIYDVVDKDLYFQYHNNNIELKGYRIGKLEVFINNTLYDELYDHNNVITCIHYNERLNMFCTTSKDGFLCLYMFPNKLMTTIKNPNGNYFNIAFLISNPFPSIIAIEEKNYELFSYSINGFFIKKASILNLLELKEKKEELGIYHYINEKGGTFKDRLFIIEENIKGKTFKCQLFNLPFFEKEEKLFEIKKKK